MFLFALLFLCVAADLGADIDAIATRIWKNESGGTLDGLLVWNRGEEFPSLGIGHFIWYPTGYQGPFEETFPALLKFMSANGAAIPSWLADAKGVPWINKAVFDAENDSKRSQELRQFLYDTRHLQAQFIIKRLDLSKVKVLDGLPPAESKRVSRQFERMASSSMGIYALIDYLNFKGDGTSISERYNGAGWGLQQVLLEMEASGDATESFVAAAKNVLTRRIANAPKQRGEERWLKGWHNRLETYLTR